MFDWLDTLANLLELLDEKFELTIEILKRFITELKIKVISIKKLYLIGITSVWISTKYLEVHPLSLRLV